VEDAIQALRHHEQQQREHSSRYFAPFFALQHQRQADTETEHDSTYLTPSTVWMMIHSPRSPNQQSSQTQQNPLTPTRHLPIPILPSL
jgi:hypothetical protein